MEKKEVSDSGDLIRYFNEKGQLHREDGPAVIRKSIGHEGWWKNDKLHREDGPALFSYKDSKGYWYIEGVEYSEEDFKQMLKIKGFW